MDEFDFDDGGIMEGFLEETQELIEALEADLLGLEENPDDQHIINGLFRSYHTIKGGAGMVGLLPFSKYAHKVENLLSEVRDGKIPVTPELISAFLESLDCLNGFMDEAQGEGSVDQAAVDQSLARVQSLFPDSNTPPPTAVEEQKTGPDPALPTHTFLIHLALSGAPEENQAKVQSAIQELQSLGTLEVLSELDASGKGELKLSSGDPLLTIVNILEFFLDEKDFQVEEQPDSSSSMEHPDGEELESKPLGAVLVEQHLVSDQDIQEALERQKPLGQILMDDGKLKASDLKKALDIKQQGDKKANVAKKAHAAASIRVDISKLDKLLNLVGEATIHQAHYSQISEQLERLHARAELLMHIIEENKWDLEGFQEKTIDMIYGIEESLMQFTKQGERVMLDLQDQVMRMRMIPIGGLLTSFRRMVRDFASKSGKKIQFEIYGEDTELDKTLTEQLSNPLKHMIRNAMDHGLEMPDVREANGKDPQGTITLGAAHKEGHIVIEIRDNGAGINTEKVLSIAQKKGLVKKDEVFSENEIFHMLFMPGFSTAEQVTDLSGRGVGMDVVKQDITSLNGVVEIQSTLGQGTTFLIKLPLTLAIIDGMLVDVGSNRFIIPLTSIVESLRPQAQQVKKVKGKGELVEVRGEYLPLVRLHRLFGLPTEVENPDEGLVVIVEEAGQKSGIFVDEAIDQQQAVIKSLEENFFERQGIAGATVLGNGQVSFILDIPGILQQAAEGM